MYSLYFMIRAFVEKHIKIFILRQRRIKESNSFLPQSNTENAQRIAELCTRFGFLSGSLCNPQRPLRLKKIPQSAKVSNSYRDHKVKQRKNQ